MKNTIILTVHNKENSITRILKSLFKTVSNYTIQFIIILDGCTDETNEKVISFLKTNNIKPEVKIIYTDNIWETKANNIGLREVQTQFATIVQDDMLIKQKDWDKILIDKFSNENIFSISGRAAYNVTLKNNKIKIKNIIGREYPISNKNFFGKLLGKFMAIMKPYWIFKYFSKFAVRMINNRGPLLLNIKLAGKLGFFDEEFAPFELDDVDLCCRAYKKFGLYSACLPIYYDEINGSKKNNISSKLISEASIAKNTKLIIERHSDLF